MCGRFTLTLDGAALREAFPQFGIPAQVQPRYNIAPGQPILAVPNTPERQATHFLWGFTPQWTKDPRRRFINARAETAAEKPTFRAAFRRRRCLVLADGFYEWHREGKQRTPYYFTLNDRQPFAMAALWEIWRAPDGSEIPTCALLTTQANGRVAPIHARMPVILPKEAWDAWLTAAETPPNRLRALLRPFPAEAMTAWAVSSAVNNARVDTPDLVMPLRP